METTFDSLACELKVKIFRNLSKEDKKKSRLVCKPWFQILNDDLLTSLNAILTDESLDTLKYCTKSTINSLTIHSFTEPIILSYFRNQILPATKILILGSGNSNANLIKFLRYYCNTSINVIEKLKIKANSLATLLHSDVMIGRIFMSSPTVQNWDQLQSLEIEVIARDLTDFMDIHTEYKAHVTSICELLVITSFPSLKLLNIILNYGTLHIGGGYFDESLLLHPFEHIFGCLYIFLTKHHQKYNHNLKSLGLNLKGDSIAPFRINQDFVQNLNLNLASIQLESLKLKLSVDELGPYLLNLLTVQSNLKHLDINTNFWFIPMEFATFISNSLMPNNVSTLESIQLDGILYDFNWLPNCTNLKSLKLTLGNTNSLLRLQIPSPQLSSSSALKNHQQYYFGTTITKFSLTSFFGAPNPNCARDEILVWITTFMPNLLELDLHFHCDFVFLYGHFMYLATKLQKLQLVTFYRPDENNLCYFCIMNGFKCQWILQEIGYPAFTFQIKVDRLILLNLLNRVSAPSHDGQGQAPVMAPIQAQAPIDDEELAELQD